MAKEFSYKQLAEGFGKWRETRVSAYNHGFITFTDLASFFDYMVLHYEPEVVSEIPGKLVSADYLLKKIGERLDNGEDLPPMGAADFVQIISEAPDARDNKDANTI